MDNLKARTIRGGFAKLCGQAANFVLRIVSMAILAPLLDPGDFGLVAMATVVAGFYGLSRPWASRYCSARYDHRRPGYRPCSGAPRCGSATLPMLWLGGTITLNGLVVYVAYNLEKVLLLGSMRAPFCVKPADGSA
jgi:hypothetical protein